MADEQTREAISPYGKLLENAGGAISLCSALAVVASTVYTWGYFGRLGLFELGFVSLADIVRSAVTWLPGGVFFVWLGAVLGTIGPRQPINRKKYDFVFPAMWAVGGLFTYLTRTAGDYTFLLPLALSWTTLWVYVLGVSGMFQYIGTVALPFLGVIAFAQGSYAANRDLIRVNYDTVLEFKEPATATDVALFRYSDNGVLYRRSTDRRIVFTTWEQIPHIAGADIQPDTRTRSCRWLGFPCPASTSNQTP
jgi:hypothetical protein